MYEAKMKFEDGIIVSIDKIDSLNTIQNKAEQLLFNMNCKIDYSTCWKGFDIPISIISKSTNSVVGELIISETKESEKVISHKQVYGMLNAILNAKRIEYVKVFSGDRIVYDVMSHEAFCILKDVLNRHDLVLIELNFGNNDEFFPHSIRWEYTDNTCGCLHCYS